MKKQVWLERAKRNAFGRMLCRVLGDDKGAVAMEYVVIALLVAAAVVGLVMVFGKNIAQMFGATTKSLGGEAGVEAAVEQRQNQIEKTVEDVDKQLENASKIRGEKQAEGGDSKGGKE
ncbi:MAG: hypothetical protein IKX48_17690 [Victivallales bacterium]|nr:hypothetical protein [Victivallales bacterium]MBR4416031.1 hypothetical protein [Victivallales bacterium]MBR5026902.1 hypothetical protein [Victivallales bacterium]MBR5078552.1 hypothetical protein [Victivallales bacterium]MBR5840088.1 hypothetical protein [Victivallales bacterium]